MDQLLKQVLDAQLEREEDIRKAAEDAGLSGDRLEQFVTAMKLLAAAGDGAEDAVRKLFASEDSVDDPREVEVQQKSRGGWLQRLFGKSEEQVDPEPELPEGTGEVEKALYQSQVEVRKELEDVRKELERTRKELDAARESAAMQEFISKAAEITGESPQSKETQRIAKVLKAAQSLPEDERGELERVLRSASEASRYAGSILSSSFGHDGIGEDTALGRIHALAKSLRESDASLTQEQAVAKVLKENPKLYAEYRRELH